jgi:hypothetical protein
MVPSRLVSLLDELQERGLVERRDHAEGRRVYAIHLAEKGAAMMTEIGHVARAHDDALCAALSEKERQALWSLLARIADDQKLTPGVHPGLRDLGVELQRRAGHPVKGRPARVMGGAKRRRPSSP